MAHDYRVQLAARPDDPETQGAARGEIARMDAYCFPFDDPPDLEEAWWWIAWKGSEAVAYAGLRPQGYGLGYMCRAGVMAAHRGHALQSRLLRARCTHARKLGLRTAITDTTHTNRASANNLIRAGFVLYRPINQWSGPEVLYWWKDL